MKIMSDDLRLNLEEMRKMLDALLIRLARFCIFQVADLVTQKSTAVARQAKSILEFTAYGKCGLDFDGKLNGIGSIATRATEIYRCMLIDAQHRVITADVNIAVM